MAKRKTTTTRPRRRARVSGINPQALITMVGGVIAGVAASGVLNKTVLAGKSPMIQALVPIAGGIAVMSFVKGDLGKYAGCGLIAAGGQKLLAKFNIGGLGADEYNIPLSIGADDLALLAGGDDDTFAMAGDDDTFAMAGDDLSVLAGDDDDY